MRDARRLSGGGRRGRGLATVAVIVALLAGTFVGQDDHFPFGPFRMYSTTNKLDGRVNSAVLEGISTTGERFEIEFNWLGLRRAEIEGQIPIIERDPSHLRHVAEAYERFHPEGPDLSRIELKYEISRLRDGVPVSMEEETLAVWEL
jgi:hypothetical protein